MKRRPSFLSRFLSAGCFPLLMWAVVAQEQKADQPAPVEGPKVEVEVVPVAPEKPAPQGGQMLEINGPAVIPLKGGGNIQVQGAGQLRIQINAVDIVADAAEEANPEEAPSWLGVQLEMNQNLDLDEDEKPAPGAGIASVVDDGPAKKAGLQSFDRILKMDGKEVKDEQDLRTRVRAIKAGKEIKLAVLRDEKEIEIKVTLEKMPAQAGMIQQFNLGSPKPDRVRFYGSPTRVIESKLDTVVLRDGNRLQGSVTSVSPEGVQLTLESGPVVDLAMDKVSSARLASPKKSDRLPVGVLLRSGGWLSGQTVGFEEGKFSLTQGDGSLVVLDRPLVAEVALAPKDHPVLYTGPMAADGWKGVPESEWLLKEGQWVHKSHNGALARKFAELPAAMEFDFTLNRTTTDAVVVLYSFRSDADGGLSASPGAVQIQLNPASLSVMQFDGMRYHSLRPPEKPGVNPAPTPEFDRKQPARFTIYSNRTTGVLDIHLQGKSIGTFEMAKVSPEDLPKAGRFVLMSGPNEMAISKISLRPWAGSVTSPAFVPEQDWLGQDGADAVLGELVKLSETEFTFAGGKSVPRGKVAVVRLKSPATVAAPVEKKAWIETRQGSGFGVDSLVVSDGKLNVKTSFNPSWIIPLEDVRFLDFLQPMDQLPPASRIPHLDTITFTNERQLTGTFVAPVVNGMLRWKISAAKNPIDFPLKEIASVLLAPRIEPVTEGAAVVRLRNGDWLPGEILGVNAGHVVFKTSFHDRLEIRRDIIQSLYTAPSALVVADAASGRKRWKETSSRNIYNIMQNNTEDEDVPLPSFSYQDGSYVTSRSRQDPAGGTALSLPIPEGKGAVSVEFTVDASQGWLNFQLMNRKGQSAYSFFCSGNRVQLNGMGRQVVGAAGAVRFVQGEQFSFQLPNKLMLGNGTIRLQFVFDPTNRAIHLGADGKKLGTCKFKKTDSWTDIGSIYFLPQGGLNGSKFSVSNVWIAPWSGSMESPLSLGDKQIRLSLANGDESIGSLVKLDSQNLDIDTPAVGPLTLPVSRVRAIEFNPPAEPSKSAYRIRLYDRGVLSGTALQVNETSVLLTTEQGEVTLPLNQVKEIVFLAAS